MKILLGIVKPNDGGYRSAMLYVISSEDEQWRLEYTIKQRGNSADGIVPSTIPDNEIWYRSIDNQKYDFSPRTNQPFDAEIVSHTYENGIGTILCDRAITRINRSAFFGGITELYLPDSIEHICEYGIRGNEGLRTLKIPECLRVVDVGGLNNPDLESFSGAHVSDDGKCVVIDEAIVAFAPKNINEYSIPKGISAIAAYSFGWDGYLEEIQISEGVTFIESDAFCECSALKKIVLPESLETMSSYAFRGCLSVEGFYGNDKFHTNDNKCLVTYSPYTGGAWICGFAGKGITDYSIPAGIEGIDNYAFSSGRNLKSISIPASITHVSCYAFYGCSELEAVYGLNVSSDNRCFVYDNCLQSLVAKKNVPVSYSIPDNVTSIGYGAFAGSSVECITMGDQVVSIDSYAFSHCRKLKSVTLSYGLTHLGRFNAFLSSANLETIYCRALVPPTYTDTQMSDFPNLKIYVPEQSLSLYQNNAGWSPFRKYFVGYKYDDLPEDSDFYISSDFSNDGKVTTLQSATEGKGINIVLMGDAYSDRQIADGTYGADMKYIYDNLFTEEPYKSFKECFNVYSVNVVSATEGYEHEGATLGGYFGDGTLVGGNDSKCFEYAAKAVGEQNMDETLVVVAMNSNNYAGTCYMYNPSSTTGTYGSGASVAYFPKGGDKETFARLLHHEACGHGFAKLADEYAYESMGAVPSDYASQIQTQQSSWGWWKNVDFTSDVSSVRWNAFTNDSRYANEGLGAFEGGLTYWTGVWRPTENSIMRDNTGGFNAPSREAIYCRIHKLAYGDSWNYSYEDFVAYDEINRKASSSSAPRRSSGRQTRWEPLHPPVVVGKSWKEAAKPQ